jgi:hypothetical protein
VYIGLVNTVRCGTFPCCIRMQYMLQPSICYLFLYCGTVLVFGAPVHNCLVPSASTTLHAPLCMLSSWHASLTYRLTYNFGATQVSDAAAKFGTHYKSQQLEYFRQVVSLAAAAPAHC